MPVPVDLLDRDLGQPVLREKRQQVMGDLVLVGRYRVRPKLPLRAVEPLGCELVEGRLPFRRLGDGCRGLWDPEPAPDVGEDVGQLGISLGACPTIPAVTEAHVVALAVRAYACRERAAVLAGTLDELSCGWTGHYAVVQPRTVCKWRIMGSPDHRSRPSRTGSSLGAESGGRLSAVGLGRTCGCERSSAIRCQARLAAPRSKRSVGRPRAPRRRTPSSSACS